MHKETINKTIQLQQVGQKESLWGVGAETEYFVNEKPQSAENVPAMCLFTT